MNRQVMVLVLIAAAALTSAAGARARSQEAGRNGAKSTMAGIYTPGQATRGEQLYLNICGGCHSARNYASQGFVREWSGHRLVELVEFLQSEMPKDDPGSLTAAQNAQIIAYLLQINRVPSGKVDLATDHAALESIVIEFPPAKVAGAVHR